MRTVQRKMTEAEQTELEQLRAEEKGQIARERKATLCVIAVVLSLAGMIWRAAVLNWQSSQLAAVGLCVLLMPLAGVIFVVGRKLFRVHPPSRWEQALASGIVNEYELNVVAAWELRIEGQAVEVLALDRSGALMVLDGPDAHEYVIVIRPAMAMGKRWLRASGQVLAVQPGPAEEDVEVLFDCLAEGEDAFEYLSEEWKVRVQEARASLFAR